MTRWLRVLLDANAPRDLRLYLAHHYTFTAAYLSWHLAMLKALPKEFWENYGMYQERGKESIAHIVRMYAGHDLNHLGQMENIVKGNS